MNARTLLGGAAAVALLALTGCTASDPLGGGGATGGADAPIVVASANFPENVILGELYAQALEAAGFAVDRQLNIGSREVLYDQVASCGLHVVPEYNQALLAFVDASATSDGTTAGVDAQLAAVLPDTLALLDSSPAQDNNAIAVTQQTSQQYGVTTLDDVAPYASGWVIGGPPEWETRADGLPVLASAYGANFLEVRALDHSGPITMSALVKGDIQAALVFSTAPEIAANDLVVLTDTKGALGVNNVTPLVCKDRVPEEARAVLNGISATLTTEMLLQMNASYVNDKVDAADVAADWLAAHGS